MSSLAIVTRYGKHSQTNNDSKSKNKANKQNRNTKVWYSYWKQMTITQYTIYQFTDF